MVAGTVSRASHGGERADKWEGDTKGDAEKETETHTGVMKGPYQGSEFHTRVPYDSRVGI
jgi:hypothetical protein